MSVLNILSFKSYFLSMHTMAVTPKSLFSYLLVYIVAFFGIQYYISGTLGSSDP